MFFLNLERVSNNSFAPSSLVKDYPCLNEQQFLDAFAVTMNTPGPIVITVGFIGYLVTEFPGACVAAAATFLSCYLFTIIPASYFKKYGKNPGLKAFVDGITAAAIGAIAGAACVLGMRQFSDWITVSIAIISALLLFKFKKIQEPYFILAAALFGLMFKLLI